MHAQQRWQGDCIPQGKLRTHRFKVWIIDVSGNLSEQPGPVWKVKPRHDPVDEHRSDFVMRR